MEDKNVEVKKEEQVIGGFDNLGDMDWELITVTQTTIDRLLKQDKPIDLLGLYMFYVYTAKWQKTWQIKATTGYVAKGLGISEDKVRKAKQRLGELGFVEDHQTKNKVGKVTGHYIKLKYPCNVKTTVGQIQSVDNQETNAYNTGNRNAYKNIINSDTLPVVAEDINSLTIDSNKLNVSLALTTPANRLYSLYDFLFSQKYGEIDRVGVFKHKAILKKLSSQIGEHKVALCLILFMNWKGASGQDSFIEKMLSNACHDLIYLPKQVTPMLAYAKNTLKLSDQDIINEVNKKLKQYGLYRESSDTTIQNG